MLATQQKLKNPTTANVANAGKALYQSLVQLLLPKNMESHSFGEGIGYHPVYDFRAAAAVLRRVSAWLDAGAYDVVIGERHRELLDEHPLNQHLVGQQKHCKNSPVVTKIDGLLHNYLENCPYTDRYGHVSPKYSSDHADDAASLLMIKVHMVMTS